MIYEQAKTVYNAYLERGLRPCVAVDRTAKKFKANASTVRGWLAAAGQTVPVSLQGFARTKALGIPNPAERFAKTVKQAKPITAKKVERAPIRASYTDQRAICFDQLPAWYLEQRVQPARFVSAKELYALTVRREDRGGEAAKVVANGGSEMTEEQQR